jgi:hypothetical protein
MCKNEIPNVSAFHNKCLRQMHVLTPLHIRFYVYAKMARPNIPSCNFSSRNQTIIISLTSYVISRFPLLIELNPSCAACATTRTTPSTHLSTFSRNVALGESLCLLKRLFNIEHLLVYVHLAFEWKYQGIDV